MKINPNDPAFPNCYHPSGNSADRPGLTIRAELAKAISCALLSNPGIIDTFGETAIKSVLDRGLFAADALIAKLNKEQPGGKN